MEKHTRRRLVYDILGSGGSTLVKPSHVKMTSDGVDVEAWGGKGEVGRGTGIIGKEV